MVPGALESQDVIVDSCFFPSFRGVMRVMAIMVSPGMDGVKLRSDSAETDHFVTLPATYPSAHPTCLEGSCRCDWRWSIPGVRWGTLLDIHSDVLALRLGLPNLFAFS